MIKCDYYKYTRSAFQNAIFTEDCKLEEKPCTCGGDTHNCDYPIMLAMQLKADATDARADADREEVRR